MIEGLGGSHKLLTKHYAIDVSNIMRLYVLGPMLVLNTQLVRQYEVISIQSTTNI